MHEPPDISKVSDSATTSALHRTLLISALLSSQLFGDDSPTDYRPPLITDASKQGFVPQAQCDAAKALDSRAIRWIDS